MVKTGDFLRRGRPDAIISINMNSAVENKAFRVLDERLGESLTGKKEPHRNRDDFLFTGEVGLQGHGNQDETRRDQFVWKTIPRIDVMCSGNVSYNRK